MAILHNLELHVTHACNLYCESCSHYSNHHHRGQLDLPTADRWMSLWSGRVTPQRFTLLGGEPTLHRELPDFLPLVRRHWPRCQLKLTTNGFFLDRHPELPQRLAETRCELCISIHDDRPAYQLKLVAIRKLVEAWQQRYAIRVTWLESYRNWTRRYLGEGESLQPYQDGDARRSWEICPGRRCRQLYQGQLWKCAPLAYLSLQHQKHPLGEAWLPYLRYQPLDSQCTDEALRSFLQQEEESYCGMCPAQARPFLKADPLRPSRSGE